MSDKNYVNHEVQTLKALYKEGQPNNDQHKFQNELQKIASSHPDELKAVMKTLQRAGEHKTNGKFDEHLPQILLYTSGKNDKVSSILVSEQNKYGETGGRHDHFYSVNGKEVKLNEESTKELNERHNIQFNSANEMQEMRLKNQALVDIEAAKGQLVWKEASNGKIYPLNPESSSHVLTEDKLPADKPFSDNCKLWGRKDAMERWVANVTGRENLIQKAISTSERLYQHHRLTEK